MSVIDPDAPWWVNTLVLLVAVAIPSIVAWLGSKGARKLATATKSDVGRVLDNVSNSHDTGLRDDLDEKIIRVVEKLDGVVEKLDGIRDDIGGLHSETRDLRTDVSGIREDARSDRREQRATGKRLDAHVRDCGKDELVANSA